MDIKAEINSNTVIVGEFNTSLSSLDKSSRQKISKETAALNYTIDQMQLIDIFRTFHNNAAQYTFFSSAHGIFFTRHCMLGHKTSLNKFKKIETISSFFSNHNGNKPITENK